MVAFAVVRNSGWEPGLGGGHRGLSQGHDRTYFLEQTGRTQLPKNLGLFQASTVCPPPLESTLTLAGNAHWIMLLGGPNRTSRVTASTLWTLKI